jgi:uncharacterized membrane protein
VRRAFKILLIVVSILYPVFVLAGFLWLHISPRVMVIGLAVVGAVYFLANSENALRKGVRGLQFWVMVSSIGVLAAITFLTQNARLLNFYPVFINLFLLGGFAYTWFQGPPMIYRLALLRDKSIATSPDQESIMTYCTIITHIWCVFFIQNTLISAATAFWGNQTVWSVYNGGISYVLIGALLGGELLYRKIKLGR